MSDSKERFSQYNLGTYITSLHSLHFQAKFLLQAVRASLRYADMNNYIIHILFQRVKFRF